MPTLLEQWASHGSRDFTAFLPGADPFRPGHLHELNQERVVELGYQRGTMLLVLASDEERLRVCPAVVHALGPKLGVQLEGSESPFTMAPGTGRLSVLLESTIEVPRSLLEGRAIVRLRERTLAGLNEAETKSASAEELGRWRYLVETAQPE